MGMLQRPCKAPARRMISKVVGRSPLWFRYYPGVNSLPKQRSFAARASYRGPVQEFVEETIRSSDLELEHLEVVNESHGKITDESHFHVFVVLKSFEGKRLIQRHRLVNDLLTKDGSLPFHSLRITPRTPEQWAHEKGVPAAPKCTGKGDGRGPTDTSALVQWDS